MNTKLANRVRRCQGGVSLIELMISLLLSMLLIAGMITVFGNNRVTYEFNQGLSRIQENARFALDHIAYNARMSGYSGCLSDVAVHNNLNAPTPFRDDIENGIQGHNANSTGEGQAFVAGTTPAGWTPVLPVDLAGEVVAGSDVLVVRSVAGASLSLMTPFSNATQLIVAGPHDFVTGEILVATDCQKASLFQLTDSSAVGAGFALTHGDTAGFSPGNNAANWGAEQDYGLGSEIARLQTHAFYVGQGADGPALFQLRLQPLPSGIASDFIAEELVGGIETMQVRYGIDPDGDGAINSRVTADAVADWTRVLSVEVTLLARATEEYGPETDTANYNVAGTQFNPIDDRRLRQVFSTSIAVRNRLP